MHFRLLAVALVISFPACAPADGSPREPASAAVAARLPAPASTPQAGVPSTTDSTQARADRGRTAGDPSATTWMVVISDFQCPYCKTWHDETYPALRREYVDAGKLRMAYLHLPLPNHSQARLAAEASMCASASGRFWEMHDRIFASQSRWSRLASADSLAARAMFDSLSVTAGVPAAQYRSCMAAGATRSIVQADFARAVAANVSSTPSFFVGNTLIEGAVPLADFRRVIDSVLAAARATTARR